MPTTTTTHPTWCSMPTHCEWLGYHINLMGGVDSVQQDGPDLAAGTDHVVPINVDLRSCGPGAMIHLQLGACEGDVELALPPNRAAKLGALLTAAAAEVIGDH